MYATSKYCRCLESELLGAEPCSITLQKRSRKRLVHDTFYTNYTPHKMILFMASSSSSSSSSSVFFTQVIADSSYNYQDKRIYHQYTKTIKRLYIDILESQKTTTCICTCIHVTWSISLTCSWRYRQLLLWFQTATSNKQEHKFAVGIFYLFFIPEGLILPEDCSMQWHHFLPFR